MKTILLAVLIAVAAFGQNPPAAGLRPVSSPAPGGTCNNSQPAFYSTADQKLYTCLSGIWTAGSGGGSPSVGTTLQQGNGTGGFQSSGIAVPSGVSSFIPYGTSNNTATNFVTELTGRAHYCVEDFLSVTADSDYGEAITYAAGHTGVLSKTQRTVLSICQNGPHTINHQGLLEGPFILEGYNSQLVLGASLASTPVTVTGCTLTAGSQSVTCSSTATFSVGQQIGGIGVVSGTYIYAIPNGTTITLSFPATLNFQAFTTNASTAITGLSSQRGLTVGQTITSPCIPAATTIISINQAANSLVSSANSTCTSTNVPSGFSIAAGSTWTSDLKAVTVTPALIWSYNGAAMVNKENQNIGAGMEGVTITDPGYRTLTGVAGPQMYGYDNFLFRDNTINFVDGPALIIGGNTPSIGHCVDREWGIMPGNRFYADGDGTVSEPVIEDITCYGTNASASDENYGFELTGGNIVDNYGDGITFNTFNPQHWAAGSRAPRQTTIGPNFQIEGGSYGPYGNVAAPYDLIDILNGGDIFVDGCEDCGVPGYGHAIVNANQFGTISVNNSSLNVSNKSAAINVTVVNGSSTVTFATTTGITSFDPTGLWDGQGMQINDGVTCTPCNVYLLAQNSVASNGLTLTLASNYTGTSGSATLTVGAASGYYFTVSQTQAGGSHFVAGPNNSWVNPSASSISLLGISNAAFATFVGQGFSQSAANPLWITENYNSLQMSPTGCISIGLYGSFPTSGIGNSCLHVVGSINTTGAYMTNGSTILQSTGGFSQLRQVGANGIDFANSSNAVLGMFASAGGFGVGSSTTYTSDPFFVNNGTIHSGVSGTAGCLALYDTVATTTLYYITLVSGVVTASSTKPANCN